MKKGFTLIELMIVIAIIAIIAAIAIPNLMASRIRANEATAISAVKAYCAAQVTFQTARYGNSAGAKANGVTSVNGYTALYSNLAYGKVPVADGGLLGLISNVFASATTDSTITDPALPTGAPAYGTPYQGYAFQEPDDTSATYFDTQYAIIAVPANSDTTGNNAYWCGVQGTVYMQGVAGGKASAADSYATVTADDTPSANPGTIPAAWIAL